MANTYTQINIHLIFAVQGRENILSEKLREELFAYMSGILKKIGCFPLAINGYKDHVHLLYEQKPDMSVSDVAKMIKSNSSKWINDNQKIVGKFAWQKGYGAFSHARSERNRVIEYIKHQPAHHGLHPFREEYLSILQKLDIQYSDNYVFDWLE